MYEESEASDIKLHHQINYVVRYYGRKDISVYVINLNLLAVKFGDSAILAIGCISFMYVVIWKAALIWAA